MTVRRCATGEDIRCSPALRGAHLRRPRPSPLALSDRAVDLLVTYRWPGTSASCRTRSNARSSSPKATPFTPGTCIRGRADERAAARRIRGRHRPRQPGRATARVTAEAERRKIQRALVEAAGDRARAADLLQVATRRCWRSCATSASTPTPASDRLPSAATDGSEGLTQSRSVTSVNPASRRCRWRQRSAACGHHLLVAARGGGCRPPSGRRPAAAVPVPPSSREWRHRGRRRDATVCAQFGRGHHP